MYKTIRIKVVFVFCRLVYNIIIGVINPTAFQPEQK
jgi:hypothetical protein